MPNAVFAYFSGTSLSGARSSEGAQAKKTYEKEEQHTREAIVEGTKTLPAVSQMPSRSVNLKKRDDQSSMSIPSPPDIICQDSIRLNVQNIIKESRPVRQHEQQEYRSAMTALKNTFANKFSNDSNRSPSTQQQPFLQQRKISTGNSKRPYEHKTGRENRKDNNIAVDEKLKDPTSYLGVPTGTSEISSELARGLRQRYQNMTKSVCEAYNQAKMLKDLMRQKKERTNNTISAILHNTDTKCRKSQQGDTQTKDNLSHDSVINTKHVFLCSSDDGLKSGKNDTRNRLQQNSTRSALKEDCKAAEARNPSLIIDILEEFGKPVVSCLLDIPEIRLPKLFLRVQNGYPRRSGTTYSFESPPMGWSNVVGLIRAEFIQSLEKTPGKYVCVGGVLEAWAKAASVILTTSNNDNRNEPLQKLRS